MIPNRNAKKLQEWEPFGGRGFGMSYYNKTVYDMDIGRANCIWPYSSKRGFRVKLIIIKTKI